MEGVRQHPKGSLAFVGVKAPLKVSIKHLIFNSVRGVEKELLLKDNA